MGRDENVYSSFLLSVDTRGLIHDIYYLFVSFCNIVSIECYIFCSEYIYIYIYDCIIQKIVMIIKYQKHRIGEFEMSKEQHERVIS